MDNMNVAESSLVTPTVTRIRGEARPLFSDPTGCWCAIDVWFYRFDYATGSFRKVFRIPPRQTHLYGRLRDFLARSWLRRRLSPSVGIDNMVVLPNGNIVVIFDRVYWFCPSENGRVARVVDDDFEIPMATPLRGGAAVHSLTHHVYYGEYLNGHDRVIRVCRVDVAAGRMEACWAFPRSEIKHIHSIHYDRFRNRLWICTGDRDHESSFYYTDDEFVSVHRFAGGDQSWRAIALLFDETGMEWGMDAGKDAPADAINHLYRYDFVEGRRSVLATIGNPAYAACEFTDGTVVMQTTFEPGRLQKTPMEAALWFRAPNRQWQQCLRFPHVPHARSVGSQYASILLPSGRSPAGRLLCMSVNCEPGQEALLDVRFTSTTEGF